MAVSNEEVKAYFQTVARQWDILRQDYYGVEVIEKALAAAEISVADKADLVVDVGCGTGFLTAGIAPYTRKVVGIDDSPGMLAVARENMEKLGFANVEFREGSVSKLPLAESVATAVFANMVLHHAPDPAVMVSEMARITQAGGRVVITDMEEHSHEWFRAEMADRWLGFTEGQLEAYMTGAGLTDFKFGWVGTQ